MSSFIPCHPVAPTHRPPRGADSRHASHASRIPASCLSKPQKKRMIPLYSRHQTGVAHATLTAHASCNANGGLPAGYASDEESDGEEAQPCLCQWHPMLIDTLAEHRADCARWPGPICGACWAASCHCDYVFDDTSDAVGRDADGRLVCAAPNCRARIV